MEGGGQSEAGSLTCAQSSLQMAKEAPGAGERQGHRAEFAKKLVPQV
jgi:hypothetical protein